jgi:nucleoside-diphosphate-sugar epimerase
MKVLVTGNLGYIGPYLGKYLKERYDNVDLIGYDAGFFTGSLTNQEEPVDRYYRTQIYGDVREFDYGLLKNIDAVVNLAAVSNDPMGNKFEAVTDDINRKSVVNISKKASEVGVNNIVFASSCSMYGAASDKPKTEEDETNPLTAYARSKIGVEKDLESYDFKSSIFTALRFSTACGFTARTRLDLVLNDFVISALKYKKISILSDGTPWRPLIHVHDMCRAIDWAIRRDDSFNKVRSVNIGSNDWNYQVKDLAAAVAKSVHGVEVSINKDAPPDKRSYQVDFSLFKKIAPDFQPEMTLDTTIVDLITGLKNLNIEESDFRNSRFIRLKVLQNLIDNNMLSDQLRYKK